MYVAAEMVGSFLGGDPARFGVEIKILSALGIHAFRGSNDRPPSSIPDPMEGLP
jgi:hypothetical protein